MKLSYVFGIASAQNPLTMQYRVERYQTQHRISGRANSKFTILTFFHQFTGYETLEELNEIMKVNEAPLLTDEMHFKTQYVSIMLSWLTQNQDHSAFENYGCHCNLSTIGQEHPFVGYRKSTSGAKDEIDWFCAQHKTCHNCLAKQTTTPCNGFFNI